MEHKGTKVIETERLILRPYKKSDAQQMYNNWATDERVTKFLRWSPHQNVELTQSLCEIWENDSQNLNNYLWVIHHKHDNTIIGSIGLVDINEKKQHGEIGYCIGYNWWGQGLVKEALSQILPYFKQIGFVRISALCNHENFNSKKLLIKTGFQYEGLLRKYDFDNAGNLVDMDVYSVILN